MDDELSGEFDGWDGCRHAMRRGPGPASFELLLADQREGVCCKYGIRCADDMLLALKADPAGFAAAYQPATSSNVAKVDAIGWKNDERLFGVRGGPLVMPPAISGPSPGFIIA